jgi:hypothetical protein
MKSLRIAAALAVAMLAASSVLAATITPETSPPKSGGAGSERRVLARGFNIATVVSSNILSSSITPGLGASRFEVETSLTTGQKLYYTVSNGSTTNTVCLNGGTALTADVGTTLSFAVYPGYSYNFQAGGGTTLAVFVVTELSGSCASRGTGGGSGSGSVSWPLTATGDLLMDSNDITGATSITGPTTLTLQAAAGNNSVLIKPTGTGTAVFYKGITFDEDVAPGTGIDLGGTNVVGARNITGVAGGSLNFVAAASGDVTIYANDESGGYATFSSDGSVALTAQGSNKSITLTPSGTGVVAVTGAITATAGLVQTRAYACVLRIGADQTIANGADRTVDLSDATADFDAGSMLTVASDRITIPAALNGKAVLVTVGHCWQLDNGGTYRYAYAEHFNVSDVSQGRVQTTSPVVNNAEGSASRWVKVSTGDYFVMKVRTGGTGDDILYGTTAPGRTYFSVVH